MKKNLLFGLVFVLAGFFASAQSTHSLSIGTSFGLLAGTSEEIVYRQAGSDAKLSQLLWDMKPLSYAGVELGYSYLFPSDKTGIFAEASFKYGFPGNTGKMEDRDWLEDRQDWLTHYSVHNNKTKEAILIDAKAGLSFAAHEKSRIKLYISYRFMQFSWSGSGGSVLHPPGSESEHVYITSSTTVGTYTQTWHIVSPGVSFYGEFNRYFSIELFAELSSLVWCTAVDEHIERSMVFTDTMNGGLFFEPGLLFSFKANSFFILSLSFEYRSISGTRGNTLIEKSGSSPVTKKGEGGAGYSVFDIGLIAKFKLF